MKLHTIEVKVHMPVNDGFRVKVSVLDLHMYINGVLVFPPNNDHEEWVVYPPAMKIGFKKIYPVEFNKKEGIWLEIHEACVEAVKLYKSETDIVDNINIEDWDEKRLKEEFDKVWPEDNNV